MTILGNLGLIGVFLLIWFLKVAVGITLVEFILFFHVFNASTIDALIFFSH